MIFYYDFLDMNIKQYKGAWLTDIDDSLLGSGDTPDDIWMASLVRFITVLKHHNILWAAVSGVAISKMGPRLLNRLPENILSHVIYYGGEGSAKSIFDFKENVWVDITSFSRTFSDAQALALIGEQRLIKALSQEKSVPQRITAAKQILAEHHFKGGCLIDEMTAQLASSGFKSGRAETYYRGGALSWMMLGDISVEHYKGERETSVRHQIGDACYCWLEQHKFLKHLGNDAAIMPYRHATRGIKIVLHGNDKGRAAEDLIHHHQIPANAILFVGNELFDGGNDNSVRRIVGLNILSVGEKQDAGVIDGGVQIKANQDWMDWFSEQNLNCGKTWIEALQALPDRAKNLALIRRIDSEKQRTSSLSERHTEISPLISSANLAEVILRHLAVMENTRHALVALRNLEYKLLAKLAMLPEYHYDEARKLVSSLVSDNRHSEQSKASFDMADKIRCLLLPDLKGILKATYVDQLDVPGRIVDSYLLPIKQLADILPQLDKLFISTPLLDYSAEKGRAETLVNNWIKRIERFTNDWFDCLKFWNEKKAIEKQALFNDKDLAPLIKSLDKHDIYYYFRRLIPRLFNFPHLKNLHKPTIILVAGTSGVGKSTISQHISKTLGISTHFSTDVATRSVLRESFRYMIGDQADALFPELYGSSFEQDNLDWFYTQSLLSMIGTSGSIDRLVKENVSAVIDGVSLIPGTLADRYFEVANIVWVVACIDDEKSHAERLGTRNETGISRGGAKRYRQKIKTIRNNHDQLVVMGEQSGAFILDNSGTLSHALDEVLHHIKTPYCDRGIEIHDPLREAACQRIKQRANKISRNS